MMTYWIEKLVVPLILMMVGGIGTVIWQYVTSPEASFLAANVRWVSVPNPLYGMDGKAVGELEKSIATAFGIVGPLSGPFRFEREMRVAVITISNVSSVRSKPVEVIAKDDSFLYSRQATPGAKGLTKKIIVQPIDPLESVQVYGVISGWPYSVSKNISAVYDNKRLPILGEEVDQEYGSVLATIVAGMPYSSSAIMFVGFLVLFILVISIPVEILASFFPTLRAKWTNEQQLAKMLNTIDIVQREDPAKLEKARAKQRSAKPIGADA
ncbi:hypothetical protein ABIF38_005509 [Bradyrhizobium japonicum]|jgi:hypothetical protein|uniref:hypothetical protein n=2 Tax=Bradyrhizobium TaxID=374 RepID=UPI00037CF514|nr:hypothetical protein [Bradyrhizobium elkanii]QOZ18522.1 hypothetical protein XI02_28445 [Bradyrhizobium sp. CCBAU 21365]MBP2434579.1 hypothetical protein [Bradyrhizobium elkanii]MCP1732179.1 hypothetical protein [Bradyrhizobium elkanii]MCP1932956.1 hypothetical protein [Bradyrhizobium elkanii]MCP1968813.1 hypothetical protein [Bradyrhizobium elkanii]